MIQTTRFGKKMKKCSAGGWDKDTRTPTGCDYVDWMDKTEKIDEDCPQCGNKLVMHTTAKGKRLKKCSTAGWDRETKSATGCTYVQWLPAGQDTGGRNVVSNGDEHTPDFPV